MGNEDRTSRQDGGERISAGRAIAVLTGVNGGHDLDVWRLAEKGVIPLGHLRGVENGTCSFAADLEQTLIRADAACHNLLGSIDDDIERTGLHAPEPHRPSPSTAVPTATTKLDLRAAGIRSVVWATGFRDDFGWVHQPVFDHAGKPVHRRGVTRQPGLYFLGLSFLHKHKSASLVGAGEDAEHLAEQIFAGRKNVRLRAREGTPSRSSIYQPVAP